MNFTSFPFDFDEAKSVYSKFEKSFSSNTCKTVLPTKPVAPTIANFFIKIITSYKVYVLLGKNMKIKDI